MLAQICEWVVLNSQVFEYFKCRAATVPRHKNPFGRTARFTYSSVERCCSVIQKRLLLQIPRPDNRNFSCHISLDCRHECLVLLWRISVVLVKGCSSSRVLVGADSVDPLLIRPLVRPGLLQASQHFPARTNQHYHPSGKSTGNYPHAVRACFDIVGLPSPFASCCCLLLFTHQLRIDIIRG